MLKKINKLIIKRLSKLNSVGLFNGRAGICIYFYMLSESNPQYSRYANMADEMLDDILDYVANNFVGTDFSDGLAGIGWSINYVLENGHIDGNVNEVLAEIDKVVYRDVIQNMDVLPIGIKNGISGYIIYFLARFRHTRGSEDFVEGMDFIIERVLVDLFNKLVSIIEDDLNIFSEPQRFNIFWNLPVVIFILGEYKRYEIYVEKVDIFSKIISNYLSSFFPQRCGSAIYLSLLIKRSGLNIVSDSYLTFLDQVSLKLDLSNEFYDKDIDVEEGICGFFLLYYFINDAGLFPRFNTSALESKIFNSTFWYDFPKSVRFGLLKGIAGIGLASIMIDAYRNEKED